MTTTAAPTDPPAPPIPAPLPPLPNPLRAVANPGAQAAIAAEGIAALRALANGASNGTTEYPYPTTTDYPLPPLPPVPVPPRTRAARRRSVAGKTLKPTEDPDIPAGSYLAAAGLSVADAVGAHNEQHPDMPAELRYNRSALLVTLATRGYVWALLRTIGGEVAAEVEVLAPPPIHALPPQGPAQALSEHLSSLRLSVAKLLYRLPHIVESFGQPCFICGRRLSDVDGLPVGGTGFLAAPPKKAAGAAEAEKESKDKDKEGKDGDGKDKGDKDKEDKDKDGKEAAEALAVPPPDEAAARGQWVTWHPSCETA